MQLNEQIIEAVAAVDGNPYSLCGRCVWSIYVGVRRNRELYHCMLPRSSCLYSDEFAKQPFAGERKKAIIVDNQRMAKPGAQNRQKNKGSTRSTGQSKSGLD